MRLVRGARGVEGGSYEFIERGSEVADSGGKYLGGRGRSLWTDSRRAPAGGGGRGTTVIGVWRSINCADAVFVYFRRARKRSMRMANTNMMTRASPPITAPTITPVSELDFPPLPEPSPFGMRTSMLATKEFIVTVDYLMTYFTKSGEGRKNNQMAVKSKRRFKGFTAAKRGL